MTGETTAPISQVKYATVAVIARGIMLLLISGRTLALCDPNSGGAVQ